LPESDLVTGALFAHLERLFTRQRSVKR
jgi:hypothetical protein